MFKRFLICVSVLVFIFTQVSFFYISASAAQLPSFSIPDLSNYPPTAEGAMSFVSDTIMSIGVSTFNQGQNLFWPLSPDKVNMVDDYFGVNVCDPETFYPLFSDYYLGNGHSGGGGYREGSPVLDYSGSYSWNPPTNENTVYLDDGAGGFFTVNQYCTYEYPYQEIAQMQVYYRGNQIVNCDMSANRKYSYDYENVSHANAPYFIYGVYTPPDSASICFYYVSIGGYEDPVGFTDASVLAENGWKLPVVNRYNNNLTYRSVGVVSFVVNNYSLPTVQNNNTTLYTYNPVTNTVGDSYYYGADDNGQPCVYDQDNNCYSFNSDGTFGPNNLYLIPDFSTLNDIDYINLTNKLTNYYMSSYFNLASQASSGNSDLYPFLTSLLNCSLSIHGDTTKISNNLITANNNLVNTNSLLALINASILQLGRNPTTSEDNSDIIILLTELKKGLVGADSDDPEPYKLDQIIELLKAIAEPDVSDDLDGDEDIDFQIDWYVKTIPDLVREKIDFSSYFTQLANVMNMLFGGGFDDVDYSSYFDTSQYFTETDASSVSLASLNSSNTNSSNTVSEPCTSDYPEVFGEELASADIPISSSVYLTAAAVSSGSSAVASLMPAPVLNVTIWGHTYNLFSYLTPEVYDKIQPFKSFITLLLYAWYLLFVVKRLPGLISDKGFGDY